MGWLKPARLTEEEIVARYLAGEAATWLAMRAGKDFYWVRDVLVRHNVAVRGPKQALDLANKRRAKLQKTPIVRKPES
jgi:hypothetical protein